MKTKKRVLPALLFSLFAATGATSVSAAQFSNVYVFGDSLSDAGYYRGFLASLGLPAPLVATLGRFTTNPGPVWSELVATHYGVTPGPSNAGGTIYAQGGARVTASSASTPPGSAQRPVSTQIDEYLATGGGAADPNALYAVWAGANDIFQNLGAFSAGAITQAQLQTNVLGAATAEVQQVARLRAAGARYVLVFALPDIGTTPAFNGTASQASVTALTAGYNTTLFSGLASAGVRVIPVDSFTLLSEVRANPALYGFTNITNVACGPFPPITTTPSSQFCYAGNIVPGGDTFLFADGVHPTARAQRIVAQFAQALIDGPSQLSLLAETPLRTRAAHVRTLSEGVKAGHASEVGKISAFASYDGATFDVDPAQGLTGQETSSTSFTLGAVAKASETFTVGVALGKGKAKATFGQNAGGYRTDENAYSVFGGFKVERFYASAAFTISDIDFNDTRRNVVLGPVVRTAESRPQGSNASGFANLGYDFTFGRLSIGPTVVVGVQNVEVQNFDEANAGSANLRIATQKRRSEVWSVGARASCDMGGWTPWVRVTADKERRDDPRFVTATPLSLATANSYDIPAYSSDTSFVTTHLGVRGKVNDWVSVGVAYMKVSGRGGIKEDGFTGTVAVRF